MQRCEVAVGGEVGDLGSEVTALVHKPEDAHVAHRDGLALLRAVGLHGKSLHREADARRQLGAPHGRRRGVVQLRQRVAWRHESLQRRGHVQLRRRRQQRHCKHIGTQRHAARVRRRRRVAGPRLPVGCEVGAELSRRGRGRVAVRDAVVQLLPPGKVGVRAPQQRAHVAVDVVPRPPAAAAAWRHRPRLVLLALLGVLPLAALR